MTDPHIACGNRSPGQAFTGALLLPSFLGLALLFLLAPPPDRLPGEIIVSPPASAFSSRPRRTILADPPTVILTGYRRTCNDCHRLFPPREIKPEQLHQHAHIRLEHGINHRCRNCHDAADRDRLVLHDGTSIPFAQVTQLCRKCHGPTWQDWHRGLHGRTDGYWDHTRGAPRRLACTECHDPHAPQHPAMDPLPLLPGPRTLRMGGEDLEER